MAVLRRLRMPAGDANIVTAIDGVAMAGLDIDTIIARLRGAPGTQVSLEVHGTGAEEPNRIVVTRDLIQPRGVDVDIRLGANGLIAEANGLWPILDFDLGKSIPLTPIAKDEFGASGDDQTHIRFVRDAERKIVGAILDPGPDEDARGTDRLTNGPYIACAIADYVNVPSLVQQRTCPRRGSARITFGVGFPRSRGV
jgi:hypothetical protein